MGWPEGTSPFSSWNWHDSSIHSISIFEYEGGTGRLTLDIDYIIEWRKNVDGEYTFLVSRAELSFNAVSGLIISINYAATSCAITPMQIQQISAETRVRDNGHSLLDWQIELNWPPGRLQFSAESFEMRMVGEPIISDSQTLDRPVKLVT